MRPKNQTTLNAECPYCGGTDTAGKGRNTNSGRQRVQCLNDECGRSWSLALEMDMKEFRDFLHQKGFPHVPQNLSAFRWFFDQCQGKDVRMSAVIHQYEQLFYPDPPPTNRLTTTEVADRHNSSRRYMSKKASRLGLGVKINGRLFFTEEEANLLKPDKSRRPKSA